MNCAANPDEIGNNIRCYYIEYNDAAAKAEPLAVLIGYAETRSAAVLYYPP